MRSDIQAETHPDSRQADKPPPQDEFCCPNTDIEITVRTVAHIGAGEGPHQEDQSSSSALSRLLESAPGSTRRLKLIDKLLVSLAAENELPAYTSFGTTKHKRRSFEETVELE